MKIPKIKDDETLAAWRERIAKEFNLDDKMQKIIREVSIKSYTRESDDALKIMKDGRDITII